MYELKYSTEALEDLAFWKNHNNKIYKKLRSIVENIASDPFSGLGKPEPLKHDLGGYWSRRLNKEHRIFYRLDGRHIIIIQCRYHYKKH